MDITQSDGLRLYSIICLQNNNTCRVSSPVHSSAQGLLEPSLEPPMDPSDRLFRSGEDDQLRLGDFSREDERDLECRGEEDLDDRLLGE